MTDDGSGPAAKRSIRRRLADKLPAKLQHLTKRDDVRQASTLTSGAMLAQLVTLGATPILSRLFDPEDFGVLALITSLGTTLGAVGALSYEMAIILPRSVRQARALFALSLYLSIFVGLSWMGLIAVVDLFRPGLFGRDLDWVFYILCAATILSTTQFNTLGYAHSRAGLYGPIATSKFNQSLLPTIAQLGFGFLHGGELGLAAGRTIGIVATNWWLIRTLPARFKLKDAATMPWLAMAAAARSYKDFLFHVPRQLLVRGATSAPPILLAAFYGPIPAGFFFFAQRIVERPGMLLGDTLSRVPTKQFAKRRADRKPLLRAALIYSAVCAAPVMGGCLLLALIAKPILPFVFGEKWAGATGYVVVIALWAAIRLSSLPMATVVTVLRLQKFSLIIDTVFAARVLVIPFMALHGRGPLEAVAAFCGLSIIYHVIMFSFGFWAAARHDRDLARGKIDLPPIAAA